MQDFQDRIVAALQHRPGWTPEGARRRLAESGWEALLPVNGKRLSPEEVADDLGRHTRCEICGHPLHPTVGDITLPVDGEPRTIRRLPHTAACSCGYARPLVPRLWWAAATAYFHRHPEAREADAEELARP